MRIFLPTFSAEVITADIGASNGVIHIIDGVLLPPAAPTPPPPPTPPTPNQTIVDIARGNPDFSTLVQALIAADLVDTLSGTLDLRLISISTGLCGGTCARRALASVLA